MPEVEDQFGDEVIVDGGVDGFGEGVGDVLGCAGEFIGWGPAVDAPGVSEEGGFESGTRV